MEYWFLFPTGLVIATLAMSTGVSGSNFWIPVYLLWLGLEPRIAFWMSLATLLFGFGSGSIGHWRSGTIDRPLALAYLKIAGPAAAAGALASGGLPARWLLLVFATFAVTYSGVLIRRGLWPTAERPGRPSGSRRWPVAAVAGLLQGAVATGSGALLLPSLLDHHERRPATAVGTTVVLVFVLSLVAISFRLDADLLAVLEQQAPRMAAMLAFAVPGVVLGGQLGPRLALRLPSRALGLYVAGLLLIVGLLVATRALAL